MAEEYDEVPVRHNEEIHNQELAQVVPFNVAKRYDDPKVKTYLLLQAYLSHLAMPIRDYITDTKIVLDSSFRIMAAIVDSAAES